MISVLSGVKMKQDSEVINDKLVSVQVPATSGLVNLDVREDLMGFYFDVAARLALVLERSISKDVAQWVKEAADEK